MITKKPKIEVRKIVKGLERYRHQDFLYILKLICSKLINGYHNILLTSDFSIEKTQKLIG